MKEQDSAHSGEAMTEHCGLLVHLCPTYLEYLAIEINMGFAEKLQQFPEFDSQSQ